MPRTSKSVTDASYDLTVRGNAKLNRARWSNPSLTNILKLADAVGVKVSELAARAEALAAQ